MYLYYKSTTNRNGISTSLTRPTVLASHKILLVLLSMTMMMSKTAVALVPTTPMPSSTSHKISHNRRRAAYHGPLWYQHNHYQHHHAMLKSSAYDDNNETETAKTKSSSTASTMKIADFEYQELKIQIKAMKEQKVTSSQLQLPKRIELEGYVKRIVNRRASPIAMQDVAKYLPGTRWRLALSTESLMSQTLPKDSTITLQFAPSAANENGDMKVDYAIEFPKTLALKRLVAKSTCTVSTSPVDAGLVRIEYDSISTDIFGFQNVGVGLFGMLKGRSTFIPTVYFDGDIWIERGVDPTTGNEYFNVYSSD